MGESTVCSQLSLLPRAIPGERTPDLHSECHACAEWPKVGQKYEDESPERRWLEAWQLAAAGQMQNKLTVKCHSALTVPWRLCAVMLAMAANGRQQPLLHCGQGRSCPASAAATVPATAP